MKKSELNAKFYYCSISDNTIDVSIIEIIDQDLMKKHNIV